jgi:hypothetical protein
MTTHNDNTRQADQLYAPTGRRITASKDWIPGNALVARVVRATDGTLDIEWEGETKICWDGQYTETMGDRRIFLDEAGNEWPEDQLTLGHETPTIAAGPDTAPRLSGSNAWTAIPHYSLGDTPEALPDNNPLMYRRIIAKRAIIAACEELSDPQESVTDLLADLRHLCDALQLDYAKCDGAAPDRYVEEKHGGNR